MVEIIVEDNPCQPRSDANGEVIEERKKRTNGHQFMPSAVFSWFWLAHQSHEHERLIYM